ncbi:hypothetical protein NXF25_007006 [Crotalus adamanteus]|uniref:Uncharacterized protein n=1 Tax=Crotalus adamanteus TaxID=8729 RepID=A0AAW1C1I2_CROAD
MDLQCLLPHTHQDFSLLGSLRLEAVLAFLPSQALWVGSLTWQ